MRFAVGDRVSGPPTRHHVETWVPSHRRVRGLVSLAIRWVAIGTAPAAPNDGHAEPRADSDWVGQRVVQKPDDFHLKVENRVVERGWLILFYRVEHVNHPRFWLESERHDVRGWALAESDPHAFPRSGPLPVWLGFEPRVRST
jgi:hypothetical protein